MMDTKIEREPNGGASNADETHGRLHSSVDDVREKAVHALEISRDKARTTARQTADAIEANPLGVVVGGLAVGALAAALLPRSEREKELLAPVGKKVSAAAVAAIAAAREVGQEELANLGLTKGAAKDQAKSLFANVAKAAGAASKAAAEAGRDEVRGQA